MSAVKVLCLHQTSLISIMFSFPKSKVVPDAQVINKCLLSALILYIKPCHLDSQIATSFEKFTIFP